MLTVSDFRTTDVALGGQGAPLVPIGDELLFGQYRYCLNLGGFANISVNKAGIRIACDICPVNMVANSLAMRAGFAYDDKGIMGSRGAMEPSLVDALNSLAFYSRKGPKSLGREWVENEFMPVLEAYDIPLEDLMRSVYEHMALQIAGYVNDHGAGDTLVTGGGAMNAFLIGLISSKTSTRLIIPEEGIVKFKEAVIFAFLGLLRYRGEINCLASVTGASRDSSAGAIHIAL
jgi:anhydro-N-acetylmuramic acid kinase